MCVDWENLVATHGRDASPSQITNRNAITTWERASKPEALSILANTGALNDGC